MTYDGVVGPWFLPDFLAAAGVPMLHYVILLPPLDVCLHRVANRTGHGFADAAATRQMYDQFAIATHQLSRHVVTSDDTPQGLATRIQRGVAAGQYRYGAAL